jgi:hypothetical protein
MAAGRFNDPDRAPVLQPRTRTRLCRQSNQSLSEPPIPSGKRFGEARDWAGIFGDAHGFAQQRLAPVSSPQEASWARVRLEPALFGVEPSLSEPPNPAGKMFGEARDRAGIFGDDRSFRATETGIPRVSFAKAPVNTVCND